MKIYIHCGNFATKDEARIQKHKLSKQIDLYRTMGRILIRERQTSKDKDSFPYEVVIEYINNEKATFF